MPLEYVSRLLSMAKKSGRTHGLAVAAAGEQVCLEAVVVAEEEGLVRPGLYGDRAEIERILAGLGREAKDYRIENAATAEEAAHQACASLASGENGILMKGLVQTGDLLHVYFDKGYGLRGERPMSHVGLFEVPGFERLFTLTDAAMNVAPDEERLFVITRNAVEFLHFLGWERPRVALLAATSGVYKRQPATGTARRVAERAAREIPDIEIVGPLALDEALSPAAAATKGVGGAIRGNADLIVVPSLECGNVIYKALTSLAHAKVVGACLGGKAPIVMTSRADTEETKLLSMALACCMADGSGIE